MEYTVPQIQHKLKIFGPFGFKEFIILGACFGVSLILYHLLPFVIFILVVILIFGIAFVFIFFKVDGIVLEKYLQNAFTFNFSQRNYFWRRSKAVFYGARVISKKQQQQRERLYQLAKEGALINLVSQINLGKNIEEIHQRTKGAWGALLELDKDEKKEEQIAKAQKIKKLHLKQKHIAEQEEEERVMATQTQIKAVYKKLEKIGEERIRRERRKKEIEERLRAWAQKREKKGGILSEEWVGKKSKDEKKIIEVKDGQSEESKIREDILLGIAQFKQDKFQQEAILEEEAAMRKQLVLLQEKKVAERENKAIIEQQTTLARKKEDRAKRQLMIEQERQAAEKKKVVLEKEEEMQVEAKINFLGLKIVKIEEEIQELEKNRRALLGYQEDREDLMRTAMIQKEKRVVSEERWRIQQEIRDIETSLWQKRKEKERLQEEMNLLF